MASHWRYYRSNRQLYYCRCDVESTLGSKSSSDSKKCCVICLLDPKKQRRGHAKTISSRLVTVARQCWLKNNHLHVQWEKKHWLQWLDLCDSVGNFSSQHEHNFDNMSNLSRFRKEHTLKLIRCTMAKLLSARLLEFSHHRYAPNLQ